MLRVVDITLVGLLWEWDLWSRVHVGFDGSSVAMEIWVGCSVGRCVL